MAATEKKKSSSKGAKSGASKSPAKRVSSKAGGASKKNASKGAKKSSGLAGKSAATRGVKTSAKGSKSTSSVVSRGSDRGLVGFGEATLRFVRISPQKARLAINMIRGKQAAPALDALSFVPKKSTKLVYKVLQSAVANAKERNGADVDKLWVVGAWVDMGRSLRRFMPRARGSASPIIKRSSHITVQVAEKGR